MEKKHRGGEALLSGKELRLPASLPALGGGPVALLPAWRRAVFELEGLSASSEVTPSGWARGPAARDNSGAS